MKKFKTFAEYSKYRKQGESRVSEKTFKIAKKFVERINYLNDGFEPETVTEDYDELKLVYFDGEDHLHITFCYGIKFEQFWGTGDWIAGFSKILDIGLTNSDYNKAIEAFQYFFLGEGEEE